MSEEEKKENPLEGYDEGVHDYLDKEELRRRFRKRMGLAYTLSEDLEESMSALSRLDSRLTELEVLLTPLVIPSEEKEPWEPDVPAPTSPARRRLKEIHQYADSLAERVVKLLSTIDM